MPDATVVPPEVFDRLLASLDDPPKANPRLAKAVRRVAAHSHTEFTGGCFRCDLSRNES